MDWKQISQQKIREAERVLSSCGLDDAEAIRTVQMIGRTVLSTEIYPEPQYFASTVYTEKDASKCREILKKAGIPEGDREQVLDAVIDCLTDGYIRRNMAPEKSDEDDILFVSAKEKEILRNIICMNIEQHSGDMDTFYIKTDLLRRMGFAKEAEQMESTWENEREDRE